MKFEAVTIKDIAIALGLSTSTVSRALRDSYEISPATKKNVLEYAEKINYPQNPKTPKPQNPIRSSVGFK